MGEGAGVSPDLGSGITKKKLESDFNSYSHKQIFRSVEKDKESKIS